MFMKRSITSAFLVFLFLPSTYANETKRFIDTPILAQSNNNELGKYAAYRSKKQAPYMGLRGFLGFNFTPGLRSRLSSYGAGGGGGVGQFGGGGYSEYTFLHSMPGSFLAGVSAFYAFTQQFGAMLTINWEFVRTIDRYRTEFSGGGLRGGYTAPCTSGGGGSGNICNYRPEEYFRYHLLSIELSAYFQVVPFLYIFAGPNFSIPFEVRNNNQFNNNFNRFNQYKRLGGFIGGQIGVGGSMQFFFAEILFKAQFLSLEGFDPNDFGGGQLQMGGSQRDIGRLLGGVVRGGVQFQL